MHIDEDKKLDKRNIGRNVKDGVMAQKDYKIYLSKLADVSDKLFNPEGTSSGLNEMESKGEGEVSSKKRGLKKKVKGKGK